MRTRITDHHYFLIALSCLCLIYLGFEFFFNQYAMILVDEFWFAHSVYQYKDSLPYRDFAPYKTVLGYYLLLPTMLFTDGILQTLVFTKNCLAILNALIFFCASIWLTRFFSRSGILASLTALLFAEVVLSYSTNIRVDLLGYWFGMFSLLCLLDKRYFSAGLLMGLGFITTQKIVWYMLASNGALGIYWLLVDRNLKTIWNVIKFNLATFIMIGLYIAIWSSLTSYDVVINSVFNEASAMYKLDWYNNGRKLLWIVTLVQNPLLFLLWPLTIISLIMTYPNDKAYNQRLIIVTYAFIILFCLIPYKQVFPYYMQVTIPVFLVLYSAFFSWLFDIFKPKTVIELRTPASTLWLLSIFCITLLIGVITNFNLPRIYLLICFIPLLITLQVHAKNRKNKLLSPFYFNIIIITLFFIGGVYSLSLFSVKLTKIDGAYQKAHIRAINSLLQDGSDYVAGINLIYNKDQHVPGMRHLMGPAIQYLNNPNDHLRAVMLASLDEDPDATTDSAINAMQTLPVKFYVNNYRMMALSTCMKNFLSTQYEHWWGSIYLYAPAVTKGRVPLELKFTGNYLIEAPAHTYVMLNGQYHAGQTFVTLQHGHYFSVATTDYRLKLIPNHTEFYQLNSQYKQDQWLKIIR